MFCSVSSPSVALAAQPPPLIAAPCVNPVEEPPSMEASGTSNGTHPNNHHTPPTATLFNFRVQVISARIHLFFTGGIIPHLKLASIMLHLLRAICAETIHGLSHARSGYSICYNFRWNYRRKAGLHHEMKSEEGRSYMFRPRELLRGIRGTTERDRPEMRVAFFRSSVPRHQKCSYGWKTRYFKREKWDFAGNVPSNAEPNL
ncbi:hypothetical protein Nepgr_001890 [Nepenthes gracilis]|uniref:Uncharacterized protein n=1 Tax=Nepenthes gracilis TaxID=150966 RepID=A0AAD3RXU7_NEPGR|nr:hypothetical protein Nepgr_001890 [Nepenthes gracilis]